MELITETDLQSCSLQKNSRVLCAFSGGADSTALLLELCRLKAEKRIDGVGAAHFEHGIRGEESVADMEFCRRLAYELNVSFYCERADARKTAAEERVSLETAARKLRYAFLQKIAAQENYDCIALAHHAQDQAETLLFHLIRGAGLAGLTGMAPRNGLLVRPLLRHTKEELLAYLAEKGQGFCFDSTNESEEADRNRIRLSVLPVLNSLNFRATEHLALAADKLRRENDFLETLVDEAMLRCGSSRSAVAAEPEIVRDRILLRLIKERTRDYSENDVIKLRSLFSGQSGQTAELTGGWKARAEGDGVCFYREESVFKPVELTVGSRTELPGGGILFSEVTGDAHLPCRPNEGYADADMLVGPLTVRPAKAGERLIPYGMKGAKLFSDFYTDKKVPISRRNTPVVFDSQKPVYVCGFTVDERVKVTGDTRRYIHFIYHEGE